MGLFGIPTQILSDNGTQFSNELMEEVTKVIGVKHLFSTPYSKEENGIVERSNKEVIRHLKAIVYEKNIIQNWRMYLPLFQRILNAKEHYWSSTVNTAIKAISERNILS
jgi:transposase InsO family protein